MSQLSNPLLARPRNPTVQELIKRRLLGVRIFIAIFVAVVLVAATLSASRVLVYARKRKFVNTHYPACRKGYALGTIADPLTEKPALLLWSGKAERNCAHNELCDDLWLFPLRGEAMLSSAPKHGDLVSNWRPLSLGSSRQRPEPRWKTSIVQDQEGSIFIFGGDPLRQDGSFLSDVWKLDAQLLQWQALDAVCDDRNLGDAPVTCGTLQRRAHAAALVGNTMYVHGGKDASSSLLSDIWALDLATRQWRLVWSVRVLPKRPLARLGARVPV